MFSKKKDKVFAWLDKILNDRRKNYRYTPAETVKVTVQVGKDVEQRPVRDLSAGGCSFHCPELKPGDRVTLVVMSDNPAVPMELVLTAEVLGRTLDGFCHCSFPDILDVDEETLHRFVLEAQRYGFRRKRMQNVRKLRGKGEKG
ncbi:PilZ domain-containing protein [Desulfobotulus sp. H1]|uniref:PilZ domain-containing protein n=1 Tax=Desulfobotulus pelophilus TaxID=2823377 RepID=A0ABT3N7Y6_9BACT|nr:PilZ domain-containing protein [Desulfobotulus pelophilus]MCW7753569.1 PilZ domain-containing protein [Desulfobotulus pelophilus]